MLKKPLIERDKINDGLTLPCALAWAEFIAEEKGFQGEWVDDWLTLAELLRKQVDQGIQGSLHHKKLEQVINDFI